MHSSILAELYGEVEARIDGGASLEEVENMILDDSSIPIEHKGELCEWAWAWKQTQRNSVGRHSFILVESLR